MALSDEDMQNVIGCQIRIRRRADMVRRNTSGVMNPKGLAWDEAAELASDARDAARCIDWLLGEVRRLRNRYEPAAPDGAATQRPG